MPSIGLTCKSCGAIFDNEELTAEHEQNQHLGPDCGHHCGILTSGGKVKHEGHCKKSCCHGED